MRLTTPSVLFRVVSDQSQGTNNTGFYQARSVVEGIGHANFYKYPKSEMREMLRDHVRSHKRAGHFISFTASIATAMEFALRKRECGERNIRIHIIDTMRMKGAALIVHSQTMLEAYDVELSTGLGWDVKRAQTSWNEFLVWDELEVDAGSVGIDDLLHPRRALPDHHAPGLIELLPNLEKTSKIAAQFSQEYGFAAKLAQYNRVHESLLASLDPPGRHGKHNPETVKYPDDPRGHQDDWALKDLWYLVRGLPKRFQPRMVCALLSLRTNFVNQDSMVEEIVKLDRRRS